MMKGNVITLRPKSRISRPQLGSYVGDLLNLYHPNSPNGNAPPYTKKNGNSKRIIRHPTPQHHRKVKEQQKNILLVDLVQILKELGVILIKDDNEEAGAPPRYYIVYNNYSKEVVVASNNPSRVFRPTPTPQYHLNTQQKNILLVDLVGILKKLEVSSVTKMDDSGGIPTYSIVYYNRSPNMVTAPQPAPTPGSARQMYNYNPGFRKPGVNLRYARSTGMPY